MSRLKASTEFYSLSLHDALPIYAAVTNSISYGRLFYRSSPDAGSTWSPVMQLGTTNFAADRKSTRLNSSHEWISYAVFCLKKKTTSLHCSHTETWPGGFVWFWAQ